MQHTHDFSDGFASKATRSVLMVFSFWLLLRRSACTCASWSRRARVCSLDDFPGLCRPSSQHSAAKHNKISGLTRRGLHVEDRTTRKHASGAHARCPRSRAQTWDSRIRRTCPSSIFSRFRTSSTDAASSLSLEASCGDPNSSVPRA